MKGGDDTPKDGKDDEESAIPSLFTYLGQFIDHDSPLIPASSLQKQNDPNALTDFRTRPFDLDCVYGRGPDDQPYMYDPEGEFILGAALGGGPPQPPICRGGAMAEPSSAILATTRTAIVSQLQGLFMRFPQPYAGESGDGFEQVQQTVRFHYQYVIVNDFLPRISTLRCSGRSRPTVSSTVTSSSCSISRNDAFIRSSFRGRRTASATRSCGPVTV